MITIQLAIELQLFFLSLVQTHTLRLPKFLSNKYREAVFVDKEMSHHPSYKWISNKTPTH